MTDRPTIERVLHELYDARGRGDLDGVCAKFTNDAKIRISGASHGNPIAIVAVGAAEFRTWLALLIKSYRLDELTLFSLLVDGQSAAAYWRARVYSRITGGTTPTEFVDLVEFRDDRIASYNEFLISP
jgi:ketosteroid isomerase-like protein